MRAVAEKAQGDMAMDYAYLDDVTYLDWQRYHALMDSESPLPLYPFLSLLSFSLSFQMCAPLASACQRNNR